MKNKSNLFKFTNVVLLITMIAIILVAGTYAKYTSTASGTSATVVANWSFNVNDKNITAENTFEFNLFDTANIKDSDGRAETDVAEGLIAPGTSGAFEFALENTSDVTAQYAIDFNVINENKIPIEYTTDGINWSKELTDIVAKSDTILPIGSGEKTITVQWRWNFGENDTVDTKLAIIENAPTITVQATITATQINYIYQEHLAQIYELSYYGNLTDAIAEVNNNTLGENNIDNKDEAEVAIYTNNGITHVVLLKDIVVPTAIKTTTDMVIDLGGHTLSSETGTAIAGDSGNLYIDGRTAGSTVKINATGDVSARAITVNTNCNLTIEGGTYISNSESGMAMALLVRGSVDVIDATLVASSETSSRTDGISLNAGATANVLNSDITAINKSQKANGIYISKTCEVTVTDSDIKGYANYNHNGSSYTASSMGIYHSSESTLTLNNSHVIGTIAGIQTYGTLYVDGGIIEGYGHGGIYFQGTNATSYIKNATICESDMIDGFTNNTGSNHVGFYVGGNSGNIYMDNCDIISSGHSLVLRATSGEKDNNLYISNSRIPDGSEIRIDDNNHKLYNGVGNNFTSADTTLPEAVIDTDIDYSTLFPEY